MCKTNINLYLQLSVRIFKPRSKASKNCVQKRKHTSLFYNGYPILHRKFIDFKL